MTRFRYHINVFWSDEDKAFIADIPDLRFCSAHGPTPEIALREILVAQKLWLTAARKHRKKLPKPSYRVPTPGERLDAMTADLDQPSAIDSFRPMTRTERARWEAAKHSRPRRTRMVNFRLNRALLDKADRLADKRGLSREQFFTELLEATLARPTRSAKPRRRPGTPPSSARRAQQP